MNALMFCFQKRGRSGVAISAPPKTLRLGCPHGLRTNIKCLQLKHGSTRCRLHVQPKEVPLDGVLEQIFWGNRPRVHHGDVPLCPPPHAQVPVAEKVMVDRHDLAQETTPSDLRLLFQGAPHRNVQCVEVLQAVTMEEATEGQRDGRGRWGQAEKDTGIDFQGGAAEAVVVFDGDGMLWWPEGVGVVWKGADPAVRGGRREAVSEEDEDRAVKTQRRRERSDASPSSGEEH
eukprot:CAMPEP_0113321376 /NCGR_PEP_ID=MMETSP0010_2-20120614/14882_1 /TAXON_ID=216773 ORGANISM="Corethron hystrix, Strain 308" /NCGR_SAMPLE_ID=MMETSP0010_2 /ASSEMBLY_ACC=CAM_ASM_000155 /LENGTH=230 /DNA_ID=CAMNT_0000179491 /DNA_START=87 /DNA_END=782 /DNA_ORIENTATION=+ /assembly_acc=CAM_ASM_000155